MAESPLEVDWEWYNTIVTIGGFLPFAFLMYVGPPVHMLDVSVRGLRMSFLWGMMSGMVGIVAWLVIVSRFTKETGVPFLDTDGR